MLHNQTVETNNVAMTNTNHKTCEQLVINGAVKCVCVCGVRN